MAGAVRMAFTTAHIIRIPVVSDRNIQSFHGNCTLTDTPITTVNYLFDTATVVCM